MMFVWGIKMTEKYAKCDKVLCLKLQMEEKRRRSFGGAAGM
jgi:hypothetical protein